MKKQRKHYTAQEKVAILKRQLLDCFDPVEAGHALDQRWLAMESVKACAELLDDNRPARRRPGC